MKLFFRLYQIKFDKYIKLYLMVVHSTVYILNIEVYAGNQPYQHRCNVRCEEIDYTILAQGEI